MDINVDFLDNMSMQAREGTVFQIGFHPHTQYKLLSLISEGYNPYYHDRTGVFEGQIIKTATNESTTCIIKVRMQLDPALIGETTNTSFMASQVFSHESKALRDCQYSGRTPTYIGSAALFQDHTGFFPGGYLHLIAMTRLPGVPVVDVLDTLTGDDRKIIKTELAKILEHIRLKSYIYYIPDGNQSQVLYHKQTQSVYVAGLSHCDSHTPMSSNPVTEDDIAETLLWKIIEEAGSTPNAGDGEKRNEFTLCFRDRVTPEGWLMISKPAV